VKYILAFFFLFIIPSGCKSSNHQQSKGLEQIFLPFKCNKPYCVLMLGRKDCSASKRFKNHFLNHIILPQSTEAHYRSISQISRKKSFYYGTPTFILYKNGRPIDIFVGVINMKNSFAKKGNQMLFNYFFHRNNLINHIRIVRNKRLSEAFYSKNASYQKIQYLEIQQAKLKNKKLNFVLFSGSLLREADFTGSDLRGSIFSHVDLKGSKFAKSNLKGVIWNNVTCPNGKNSDMSNNGCESNL